MHTYTAIYLHVTFVTFDRQRVLTADLRPQLHAYIAGTARNLGIHYVHVGGYDDHVHLFGRFDPAVAPSTLVGQIKQSASRWLREEHVTEFRRARGYGAFSVSRNDVPTVIRYIQRQEAHHRRRRL